MIYQHSVSVKDMKDRVCEHVGKKGGGIAIKNFPVIVNLCIGTVFIHTYL